MERRGPLADSYPAAVALVVCALVPFLLLTGAVLPLAPLLSKSPAPQHGGTGHHHWPV